MNGRRAGALAVWDVAARSPVAGRQEAARERILAARCGRREQACCWHGAAAAVRHGGLLQLRSPRSNGRADGPVAVSRRGCPARQSPVASPTASDRHLASAWGVGGKQAQSFAFKQGRTACFDFLQHCRSRPPARQSASCWRARAAGARRAARVTPESCSSCSGKLWPAHLERSESAPVT
jgi:hypothetical protein